MDRRSVLSLRTTRVTLNDHTPRQQSDKVEGPSRPCRGGGNGDECLGSGHRGK